MYLAGMEPPLIVVRAVSYSRSSVKTTRASFLLQFSRTVTAGPHPQLRGPDQSAKLLSMGQMAHNIRSGGSHMTTHETVRHRRAATPTKDLDRFERHVRRGTPGSHAYVILLGLDTFDPAALL